MQYYTHSHKPGDFYITRHSNLSQVHVVFHLVTDDLAVQSIALKARHPVLLGLKNCLRTAARYDVHHISVPLLLVHSMQPVSDFMPYQMFIDSKKMKACKAIPIKSQPMLKIVTLSIYRKH